jgi:hypothetical protein
MFNENMFQGNLIKLYFDVEFINKHGKTPNNKRKNVIRR